jgi:hypothetical protein
MHENTVAETIEEHYDEIDLLREVRNTKLSDYVAWEVYDYDTDERVGIYEDREEAYSIATEHDNTRSMFGLKEGDERLDELR